jgi:predicted transcriptional regulator
MMKEYLGDLISRGLIKESKTKEGRTYSITDNGNRYISEYGTIVSFMDSFGLSEEQK